MMPEIDLLQRRWMLLLVLPVVLLVACAKTGQAESEPVPNQSPLTGYWDSIDFNNPGLILNPEQLLKPSLKYFLLLERMDVGKESAVKAFMGKLLRSDSILIHYMTTQVIEKYLFEAGSPVRNDNTYLMIVKHLLTATRVDSFSKIRFESQVRLLSQNMPGVQVNNFEFIYTDGRIGDLHSLPEFPILLYFNNPDCEACRQTTQFLANSKILNNAITTKRVQLLTIYADREPKLWESAQFPISWTKVRAYNPDKVNDMFDLRAIPCLYLLDSRKNVVIKDGLADEILMYIKQI